jgi:hypothetical protein
MASFKLSVTIPMKAVNQLGPLPVLQTAFYRLGLRSGYWRWRTPVLDWASQTRDTRLQFPLQPLQPGLMVAAAGENRLQILEQAEEICTGKVRLFGGPPVLLILIPHQTPQHWTAYERGKAQWGSDDPKLVWESARFGWAFLLARAYALTGNDGYAQTFWRLIEEFIQANPPYLGPQWVSGQEVAMRIIAWTFCASVFADSPATTPERSQLLAASLAAHAARIPPTLIYAVSQNNNHLLSEAAGLMTAGVVLADLPQAGQWFNSGWTIFNRAIQRQVGRDGTYVQHSTNYHRLMLQLALWVKLVAGGNGKSLPHATLDRLSAATSWLGDRLDPDSGGVPNLGHNDGSLLLPLSTCDFSDFRPIVQAASRAFLGAPSLPPGPWDELSLWTGLLDRETKNIPLVNPESSSLISAFGKTRKPKSIIHAEDSWASLRAVRYFSRPGHCDQLHVDLWWKGQNLARDAGTYSYNAADPWQNALANTNVHNTVQVDGIDQMRKSGRFLWLDWVQASFLPAESGPSKISAEHTGYQRLGIRHKRSLAYLGSNHWQVTDTLSSTRLEPTHHSAVLHWLMPDLPWELHGTTLRLKTSQGILSLRLSLADQTTAQTYLQLVRAGEVVAGPGKASPVLGWFSPNYNLKIPALSLRFIIEGVLPLSFTSDWFLP